MASWGAGTLWGGIALWGAAAPAAHEICDLVERRILFQMDSTIGNRDFRDFMCIHAEPFGQFTDVADEVADGFNLNTAIGIQLDMIGSVIDLPRSGFDDDDDYRTLLKVQATILMGQTDGDWTGSVNQILTMVRTFIDHFAPTASPIVYTLSPPYAFSLSIPSVLSGPEFGVLFRLLCKAVYAAVLGFIELVPVGDNLWDSSHGAVTNSGIWCSSHGPTATPCANWSGLVVTSGC